MAKGECTKCYGDYELIRGLIAKHREGPFDGSRLCEGSSQPPSPIVAWGIDWNYSDVRTARIVPFTDFEKYTSGMGEGEFGEPEELKRRIESMLMGDIHNAKAALDAEIKKRSEEILLMDRLLARVKQHEDPKSLNLKELADV